jgi:hypothetical protein
MSSPARLPALIVCFYWLNCPDSAWTFSASFTKHSVLRVPILFSSFEETTRAGSDGYSVLRQPASRTSWDPAVDPKFDVPSTLDEDQQSASRQLDDDWWSNRNERVAGRRSFTERDPMGKPLEPPVRRAAPSETRRVLQPEDLDLFQRSLDTLDYPQVLRALEAECTTTPARILVQRASDTTKNSNRMASKKIPNHVIVAYRPLMADTVEGSQERYTAVQEMEWILLGGSGHIQLDIYSYRNRKGYK